MSNYDPMETEETREKRKRVADDVGDDYNDDDDDDKERRVLSLLSYLTIEEEEEEDKSCVENATKRFHNEHCERLAKLLRELVRQRNWRQASGVLSVLMLGTSKDKTPQLNRLKYSLCMEILKHTKGDEAVKASQIDFLYDTWITRTDSSSEDKPVQDSILARLEQIIFLLTQGNDEDAYFAAISLMQHPEFGKCSLSYMVVGLTFYQLLYSKYLKEIQHKETEGTPCRSEILGTAHNDPFWPSEGHNVASGLETEASFSRGSETSVMIDKRKTQISDSSTDREASTQVRDIVPQHVQPLQTYAYSDEDHSSSQNDAAHAFDASLIQALEGIEPWLLPLQLPQDSDDYLQMLNDPYYKQAVKYLRLALHSTPPMFAALHPLVQLLLIGGRVDNALKEVEGLCKNSRATLAFRIRASILECFNRNSPMLAKHYQDVLRTDPTCRNSLTKLVKRHHCGDYSAESLVEMIALHLDATYGDHETWREFASCFLKLSQSDEDRLSVCLNGNGGGEKKQCYSVRYSRTPKLFTEKKSRKAWGLRCKWWMIRHFSNSMLLSEIAKGDLQLLTYKAACACHMYGNESSYVVKVYGLVENGDSNRDLFIFLQMHRKNSIRFYPDFMERAT